VFSTKRHWNPGRAFGSRPKVEIWSPLIVESDYFPIDHRVLGQIAEGLDDIRVLSVERFSVSGNKAQLALRVDCDSAVSIEFDFLCGDEIYAAQHLGSRDFLRTSRFCPPHNLGP
jgi:hypothetical protein